MRREKSMRYVTRRSKGVLSLGLMVVFAGCGPSEEELEAERARVRRLQGELQEAQQQRQSLEARLQTLQAQNEEMASRLGTLGESLEQAEGDRRELVRALEELRTRQRQAQARLATFRNLLEQFQSMIESGRLRVRIVRNRMVVELPEGVLFDSGKARLKPGGRQTLAEVAQILKDIKDRQFQIAGHTDDRPIRTRRYPSNWELSAARAVNVARFLIDNGVAADRLSAAGYADTEPVASNDTPAGRQQNRRIEIVLVPNLEELPDLSALRKLQSE